MTPTARDCLIELTAYVGELKVKEAISATRRLNELGVDPKAIMTACEEALTSIGERYAAGEYFIAGLIMAGEVVSRVLELLTPRLVTDKLGAKRAKVLIGTVKGDIHGLGKNIAGALLTAYGFEVRDLGVDVPCSEFVSHFRKFNPDIVGLSVLLTSCFPSLVETIAALSKEKNSSGKPSIFISGGQIRENFLNVFGADYYVETAFDTVKLCERLVRPM
jgi:methanogenic corrinoid protein MtbC1